MKRIQTGFTLIEIMVVVILGILAAIVVPRRWRDNFDETADE